MQVTTNNCSEIVRDAVAKTEVVDIHTHLFPPSHGDLMFWGIDEVLTYHYLIQELFVVVGPKELCPERFWKLSKQKQADIVWQELFVKRTPISEACRGVITLLNSLGIVFNRRTESADALLDIREEYKSRNAADLLSEVFQKAGIKYVVMTNDPFDKEEIEYWKKGNDFSSKMKAALRVDTLIFNFDKSLRFIESEEGLGIVNGGVGVEKNRERAVNYLLKWAKIMNPHYMAVSVPDIKADTEAYEIIKKVIIPVATTANLPLALMIGVIRGVNPPLLGGGDGVEPRGDFDDLAMLLREFPNLKVLATHLSRSRLHDLCVLARLFGNLHVFGNWWYCNNTSIVEETARMRIEMLGTAFTFQHSDSRVLEHLLYKWEHSKCVLAEVLSEKYGLLIRSGWKVTVADIERDVHLLLGGMYEEFLQR